MTTITKEFLAAFRKDLDAALKQVCDKHGLVSAQGNIRFTSESFKMSNLEFTVANAKTATDSTPTIDPTYYNAMKRYGAYEGMSVADIGRKVVVRGKEFEILGLGKIGKFVVGKSSNGKLFKLSFEDVKTSSPAAALHNAVSRMAAEVAAKTGFTEIEPI